MEGSGEKFKDIHGDVILDDPILKRNSNEHVLLVSFLNHVQNISLLLCMHVHMHVHVQMCVCVCKRERERVDASGR